jgi:dTDP-D-glucose 4,6-dehydratase
MVTVTYAPHDATDESVRSAACHLYDAECAVHVAHQSHVDEWIEAASNRLHEALGTYLSLLAACAEGREGRESHG